MSRLIVAAVVAASVIAWSGNAFAQAKIVDGPEVRWKLAAWGKPRAATQNVETLKKFMDERTGGKFKIQIGYESFGQPKELLDLLKVGSLEMTNICASYHPEKLPVYSALDLPFLPIPDLDVQEKVHLAFHKNPLVVKEFAGERHAVSLRRAADQRVRAAARRQSTSTTSRAARAGACGHRRRCASWAPYRPRSTPPKSAPRSSAARPTPPPSRHLRTPVVPHLRSASGTPRT
jgi:hypothetical protein